jgi:hypothetical protein
MEGTFLYFGYRPWSDYVGGYVSGGSCEVVC